MTIDAFRNAVDAMEPLVRSWASLVDGGKPTLLVARKKANKLHVTSATTGGSSAHTLLALAALLPKLQDAAVALDMAFQSLSWARHRAQKLGWSIGSNGHQSLTIGSLTNGYIPAAPSGPGRHPGLRAIEDHVLGIHNRLDGITVQPTDPIWKVASKPIGAPDAGTAQLMKLVFDNHKVVLPPDRFDTVALMISTQTLRAEMAAALQRQTGVST